MPLGRAGAVEAPVSRWRGETIGRAIIAGVRVGEAREPIAPPGPRSTDSVGFAEPISRARRVFVVPDGS